MKKIFAIFTIVLFGLATSNGFAQKASKEFKNVVKTYEKQTKWFFEEVFALQKTGTEMDTTTKEIMEKAIYQAFLDDFSKWAKFVKKSQGSKKFDFTIKPVKGFESEGSEYRNQFKQLQNQFVNERLTNSKEELEKTLTKEKLQPYINGVIKKFKDRTKKLIEKLKA